MRRTYEVKIYSAHDCDLYSIHMLYRFNFPKAIYCSLNAFLKKQAVAIKMPERRKNAPARRKLYRTTLILDDQKNAELVHLLDSIRQGYRNCFIKNILRLYLFSPGTEAFFVSGEAFENVSPLMLQMREGQKLINAAEKRKIRIKPKGVNKGIGEVSEHPNKLGAAAIHTAHTASEGLRSAHSEIVKEAADNIPKEQIGVKGFKPQEADKGQHVQEISEVKDPPATESKESNADNAGISQQAITNILFDIISQ